MKPVYMALDQPCFFKPVQDSSNPPCAEAGFDGKLLMSFCQPEVTVLSYSGPRLASLVVAKPVKDLRKHYGIRRVAAAVQNPVGYKRASTRAAFPSGDLLGDCTSDPFVVCFVFVQY
jgi:hypothetical protein